MIRLQRVYKSFPCSFTDGAYSQNKQSLSRICLERVGINFISNLQDKINQNWTLNKIR
jgi:hypothetical protein